jgi:hypothetical protein
MQSRPVATILSLHSSHRDLVINDIDLNSSVHSPVAKMVKYIVVCGGVISYVSCRQGQLTYHSGIGKGVIGMRGAA